MIERIVLTTGGTGGHIFPALAVAEELRRRSGAVRVLFVGSERGPEGELARGSGLDFVGLPVAGFLGRGMRAVSAGLAMARGLGKAWNILGDFRPQVVAGFGGYAGFAAVAAAWLRRTPCVVHEQNSVPGMTNRLLARVVDQVLVSFPDEDGHFPHHKVLRTGNPVRRAIRELGQQHQGVADFTGRKLLVLGGSQGARAVNSAVVDALEELAAAGVVIRHQSGSGDFERVRQAYQAAGVEHAEVEPFIADMASAYEWADLVLARAGATTIAELACAGKPAVLVPFPHATHDHQAVNAAFLAAHGAAVVLPETQLSGRDLAALLIRLLADPQALAHMAACARELGVPEAAARVADVLESLEAGSRSRHHAREGRP